MRHAMKNIHWGRVAAITAALAASATLALSAGCTANDSALSSGGGSGGVLVHLQASPRTVTQGNPTTLLWNHPEASSCTLSGTAPDGSAVPASGFTNLPQGSTVNGNAITLPAGGTVTTPTLTQLTSGANRYTFSLVCTNSDTGNAGTPESATVTVTPPASNGPSVTGQHADPNPVAAGGQFVLSWTATPGSSCVVTGQNAPTTPVTSGSGPSSVTITAPATAGTYSYAITCTGTDGQNTTVTVPVAVGSQVALTVSPTQTSADGTGSGTSSTLLWNHPQAQSCALTGTDPSGAAIPGSQFTNLPQGSTVSGNTVTVPPGGTATTPKQTQVGTYTYTLACQKSGGAADGAPETASVTVTQQAVPTATGNCDNPDIAAGTAAPLVNAASATTPYTVSAPSSGLCIGCSVSGQGNLVDADLTNAATVNIPVGLLSLQAVNGVLNTVPGLSALLGAGGALGPIIGPVEDFVTTPLGTALGGAQAINLMGDGTDPVPYKAGQAVGFVVNPAQQLLAVGAIQFFSICPLDATGKVISAACSENIAQPGGAQGGQADPVKLQALDLTQGVAGSSTPNVFYSYVPPADQFGTSVDANGVPEFYGLQLTVAGVANVNNNTKVFYGCVADPAPSTP